MIHYALKIIFIFIGIAGLYWQLHHHSSAIIVAQSHTRQPDWFAKNMVLLQYGKTGTLQYQILGKQVEHYDDNNTIEFYHPQFEQFNAGKNTWNLIADRGLFFQETHLQKESQLNLWNHVNLTGEGNFQAHTTAVSIFPKRNMAITEEQVTLSQPNNQLTGRGMTLLLDSKTLQLHHNVVGTSDAHPGDQKSPLNTSL